MSLAVVHDNDFAAEVEASHGIQARFRNPAMPSVVSQADAMTKMVAAIPWLAESDVVLEELGFTEEQIVRLRSARTRSQSSAIVAQAIQGTGLGISAAPDDQ